MFQKPKHKAAVIAYAKADGVLAKVIKRDKELSEAVATARGQLADQARIESELLAKELPLQEVQKGAQQITAERARVNSWLDQLGQMQARASTDTAAAVVEVIASEKQLNDAVGEYYAAEATERAEKLVQQIRAAYRDFVSVLAGAEYFRGLAVSPAQARDEFHGSLRPWAWERLGEHMTAAIDADATFYAEMDIGKPALGGPPIEAANSTLITPIQRKAVVGLQAKNQLTPESLHAALEPGAGEQGLTAWDRIVQDPNRNLKEDLAACARSSNHWEQLVVALEQKLHQLNFAKCSQSKPDWEKDEIAASIKNVEKNIETARDRLASVRQCGKELRARANGLA